MSQVIRSFGAVRPNPFWVHQDSQSGDYIREDKSISNFIIHEAEDNHAFLSLIGIKTPGLTCASELGMYAADKLAELLGNTEKNPAYNPKREAPIRLNDQPYSKRARIVEENPAYGRIICRCRNISEGEILDSLRRNPGAVTVDGVKRRTGACTGRCQGSFCTQRIIEIIARELGISPSAVNKDGPGSYVIGGIHDAKI
jgi:glycerol-3-phosphate dehydrogenase